MKTLTGESPFALTYGSEVVVLVEIGIPSYRVKNYNEEPNNKGLEEHLDPVEETREEAEVRMVFDKRKA